MLRNFLLIMLSAIAFNAHAVKPTSPLQLSMTLAADPVPGEFVEVVLTAISAVASNEMLIELLVPKEVPVRGERSVNVKAVANTPQTLRVPVQVPATGSAHLQATATIIVGTATFTARADLMLGKRSTSNQKSIQSQGVLQKRSGNNGTVIEFPIR